MPRIFSAELLSIVFEAADGDLCGAGKQPVCPSRCEGVSQDIVAGATT